jgi:hypothetical protein
MHSVRFFPALFVIPALARPAEAHVKWFAPYIVDASPRPLGATLTDPFFWLGIALVLVFFLTARMVEPTRFGASLSGGMTRIGAPLDRRLDDFLRAAIAAFFIAIFAVGGIYLTPDLKTDSAFIPWVQLIIALCLFFRSTMPVAAVCVVDGAARLRAVPSAGLLGSGPWGRGIPMACRFAEPGLASGPP